MKRALICIAALGLLLTTALVAGAVEYRIRDLGIVSDLSRGFAINDSGAVTGIYSVARVEHLFRWEDGTTTDLGVLTGSTTVNAIGNSGLIVGTRITGSAARAFSYDTAMQDLSLFEGSRMSAAYDINNAGLIVGSADTASSSSYVSVWEDGVIRSLGFNGTARGVNDLGEIVGIGHGTLGAFLWRNGNIIPLGGIQAMAINNSSTIIGYFNTGTDYRACIMHEDGTLTNLGGLGGNQSMAYGINNSGLIVGQAMTSAGATRAVFWENNVLRELDTLRGSMAVAWGVNDSGVIVGQASDQIGVTHAVVWEPVPEPSCVLALLSGLAALGTIARRRR